MGRQSSSPEGAPSLEEEVQFSSLRALGGVQGGIKTGMWSMLTWERPGPGGEVTNPALGVRDADAPPACRWESQVKVSSPINWRVETLPPSPWGTWTLARAGLPGKPGQLFVGLPGPPGRRNLESELRTYFLLLKPTALTFPRMSCMSLGVSCL